MASDLIYREDAKVFVRHACYKKINPIDYLDEVPAADVRPVVRGKWGLDPQCPVCGEDRYKGLDAEIWADWEPPFCPNCGAYMEVNENG